VRIAGAGALVAVLWGCAHIEPPPGGPEDSQPPAIIATRPDTQAVVPGYDGPVVFTFGERISERGVETAVLVSPRTSPVEIRQGRSEIRVSLRQGWEPDQVYHVTLLPEIADLFGNRLLAPQTLVFSTGPPIPETRSAGTAIDRITGRPERNLRVEAIRAADSLVYAVQTDTAGAFALDRIPEGEYQFRAYEDVNRSRSLDDFERRDSTFATVRVGEPVSVAFRVVLPDTTPPAAGNTLLRQRRLEITFDDYLDPEQAFEDSQVEIVGPGGTRVEVEQVAVGNLPPSTATLGAAPATPGPTTPVGATPATPLPSRILVVLISEDAELPPATEFAVRLRGVLNINTLAGDSETVFDTPPAPPGAAPAPGPSGQPQPGGAPG
jgi:hypothetical protein